MEDFIQFLSYVDELEARETSNNTPFYSALSWNELCDKMIEILERAKT